MDRKQTIINKLKILNPSFLEVADESHKHAGHRGNSGTPNSSHFKITLSAKTLEGKTKLQQHKIINQLLSSEFENGLHALSIKIIPLPLCD